MVTQLRKQDKNTFAKNIILTARLTVAAVLFLVFLWHSLGVLLLILSGILVAVVLRAGSDGLCRYTRLSPGFALGILVVLLLLLLAALITAATPTLVEQVRIVVDVIPAAFDNLRNQLNQFGWGQELLLFLDTPRDQLLRFITGQGQIFEGLTGVFSTAFEVVAAVFVILLLAIYLAAEPMLYIDGFVRLFPVRQRARIREVLMRTGTTLKWWFFGQTLSMILLGILMTLGLWLLEVPLALTMGMFTAIMTFIPNFGPIIAGVPTLLLALSVGPMTGLYALVLIVIIQNIEGMFITPMIHRRIIALPPALVIATQIGLASVYGFIGLIMAMPLVTISIVCVRMLYVEDVLEADLPQPNPPEQGLDN